LPRSFSISNSFHNEEAPVVKAWDDLPGKYRGAEIDEFAAVPNHIYGIKILSSTGAQFIAPFRKTTTGYQVINHAPTAGKIVRVSKARCTRVI
jgi:hypothetical protein